MLTKQSTIQLQSEHEWRKRNETQTKYKNKAIYEYLTLMIMIIETVSKALVDPKGVFLNNRYFCS